MNFDINMLSTLMQMLGAQKQQPARSENYGGSDTNAAQYDNSTRGKQNKSVFAMQNGLGDRVDFETKQQKKEQTLNPMASILEMMTGKGAGQSGDMMSSLMPMLMNAMSSNNKNTQKTSSSKTNSAESASQTSAKNNDENLKNKQSKPVNLKKSRLFEPIYFAGYPMISALNRLYLSKLKTAK